MINQAKYNVTKARLKAAKSTEEIYSALSDVCDLLGYHWNRERSFLANANIAELGLMPGVAEAFRLAHTKLHEVLEIAE
jgi:prophage antirepressor-like protein